METKAEGIPVAAERQRVSEIQPPEPSLAWADELRALYLEGFVILVAEGARATVTPPVTWSPAPPFVEPPPGTHHRYSLHLSKPERFLHAAAFPMRTLVRSVTVRYAGHPEGVAVPVTPIKVPEVQELLARGSQVMSPDERRLAPPEVGGEWRLAPARFILPISRHGHLLLVAGGENPSACFEVKWRMRRPDSYALLRRPTGKICPDVPSPYMAAEVFRAEPLPEAVWVISEGHPEGRPLQVIPLEKLLPHAEEAPLAH